ncbi:DNA-binding protein [Cronobacter sakazakii]|nr:DNA-binding protein [Cronobacter sakazakii]MBF4900942.1 DNA-binding protein [Cronobacter sakazakii]MBF4907826.1 DNA-binding protein [Cronobacter sakazakii]PUV72980.1 DNA-binding protein [Cronobacter sakazakii]PUV90347.1 DNA-binding protein [Cronobacter sakazakii]
MLHLLAVNIERAEDFPLWLWKLGIVEQKTRRSRSGVNGIKKFWSLTAKGCMYGKNITSPANPRETQPHFFESRAPELFRLLETVH